jgi:hypothetical protein
MSSAECSWCPETSETQNLIKCSKDDCLRQICPTHAREHDDLCIAWSHVGKIEMVEHQDPLQAIAEVLAYISRETGNLEISAKSIFSHLPVTGFPKRIWEPYSSQLPDRPLVLPGRERAEPEPPSTLSCDWDFPGIRYGCDLSQ